GEATAVTAVAARPVTASPGTDTAVSGMPGLIIKNGGVVHAPHLAGSPKNVEGASLATISARLSVAAEAGGDAEHKAAVAGAVEGEERVQDLGFTRRVKLAGKEASSIASIPPGSLDGVDSGIDVGVGDGGDSSRPAVAGGIFLDGRALQAEKRVVDGDGAAIAANASWAANASGEGHAASSSPPGQIVFQPRGTNDQLSSLAIDGAARSPFSSRAKLPLGEVFAQAPGVTAVARTIDHQAGILDEDIGIAPDAADGSAIASPAAIARIARGGPQFVPSAPAVARVAKFGGAPSQDQFAVLVEVGAAISPVLSRPSGFPIRPVQAIGSLSTR